MKLIQMTDFVLEQSKEIEKAEQDHFEAWNKTVNYANFLKQPLELWMFVPCEQIHDESVPIPRMEWVAMREPNKPSDSDINAGQLVSYLYEYQKAKERVLFEGYYIEEDKVFGRMITNKKHIAQTWTFVKGQWKLSHFIQTVEGLTTNSEDFQIDLTPTALKQIELL